MMKVATIVGARPQFIKAAAVSRALRALPGVTEVLIHTGQHYDRNLSEVFFRGLSIPAPDHQLDVGSGPHGAQTGRMLEKIEAVLAAEKPDWTLVYGDTNSTLAGALAAAKLHRRVAHVEAGVRSFDRRMPEEINRVLTDHVSDLLFAPTETAVKHLGREGIAGDKVHLVGDVMYDVALLFGEEAERSGGIGETLGLVRGGFAFATVHRAENTDDTHRLATIVQAFNELSVKQPVVLPLHPRTRGALERAGLRFGDGVRVIEPVGYVEAAWLEKNARVILTDSGGVQREAFFFRSPCVVLRDRTEWVELVESGSSQLADPVSTATIHEAVERALGTPVTGTGPFGDGTAARKLALVMKERFEGRPSFG